MTGLVLVVDDDTVSRLVLCHMLRHFGWTVDEAADVPAAIEDLGTTTYDLVISDYHLPSGNGIDVLEAVEQVEPTPPFVLVTGVIEHSSLSAALTDRITSQLTKPVSTETLGRVLDALPDPGEGSRPAQESLGRRTTDDD